METLSARKPFWPALGRWRGSALADVAGYSWALGETARLERLRIGALESWLIALIDLGRSTQAVAEAEAAVEADPYSDGLWATLMKALHRSGRQTEALRAYQRLRELLDESGLEPSGKLSALEEAIARDDPELSAPLPSLRPVLGDVPSGAEHAPSGSTPPENRSNLPIEISSFVGREVELAELAALLSASRLVAITGAGGLGKTRLAVQVATELASDFDQSVFVDLAPLSDQEHVIDAVAQVFGVREEPGRPLVDTLLDALRTRKALIVLDNCEHVVESSAQLAEAVIRSCPDVHFLASSRERLNVRGERVFQITPLSLPNLDGHILAGSSISSAMRRSEAVQLFVERARENRLDFELTDENARNVASICCQLDGMPLAIELAAARLRSFSVSDIDKRLRDRFALLTTGPRTASVRQRTLAAAVQWSYDLLNPDEQWVLRRLSVFRGGWALEAAESLCAALTKSHPEPSRIDVVDALSSLVDKSLVYTEMAGSAAIRYRALETIRDYAAVQLDAEGDAEVEAVQGAHVSTFLALVMAASDQLAGREQSRWLAQLELEHENLRAAVGFCLQNDLMHEYAVLLVIGLRPFWAMKGYYQEATSALDAALELDCLKKPSPSRAKVLVASGQLNRADRELAKVRLAEARMLAWDLSDRQLLADALCEMAWIEFNADNTAAGIALATEGLAAAEESDDLDLRGFALSLRGSLVFPTDQEAGRADFKAAIEQFTATGNSERVCSALCRLAIHELEQGDREAAKEHLDTVFKMSARLGNDGILPFVWAALGHCAMLDAEPELARQRFHECLKNALRVDDSRVVAYACFGLAYAATAETHGDAAKLYGAADRLLEEYDEKLEPSETEQRSSDRMALLELLGEARFDQEYDAGYSLTPIEATTFVCQYIELLEDPSTPA